MPNTKEIRTKIKTIKNTQKITKAMEMVATSKMRRAQDRMVASRPYAEKIKAMVSHVAQSHSEYHHSYLTAREIKNVGYIIVGTDRGLCGGLNANLFKRLVADMKKWHEKGVDSQLFLIGRKAEVFFSRYGGNVKGIKTHLGDRPLIEDLLGIVKIMLDAYQAEHIDRIYVVYNQFVNSMQQEPIIEQLLPLEPSKEKSLQHYWDYIYEPDARELLDKLVFRYLDSRLYQAVVENIASEQAARMVAMKNASDNAADLIKDFQLIYNKVRQAAITREIAEIVGGAAAISG